MPARERVHLRQVIRGDGNGGTSRLDKCLVVAAIDPGIVPRLPPATLGTLPSPSGLFTRVSVSLVGYQRSYSYCDESRY
jgi:hypothetical protein